MVSLSCCVHQNLDLLEDMSALAVDDMDPYHEALEQKTVKRAFSLRMDCRPGKCSQ